MRNFGDWMILFLLYPYMGSASDFTPPKELDARKALQSAIISDTPKDQKIKIWLDAAGKPEWTDFEKADEKQLYVKIQGNTFSFSWEKLTPEQCAATGNACLATRPESMLKLADYQIALNQFENADKTLSKAVELKPELSPEIKSRWDWLQQQKPQAPKPDAGGDAAASTPSPNAANALKELTDFSTAGFDRRFGPDASTAKKSSSDKILELYCPPVQDGPKGRRFQYGVWKKEGGDFSSTQGQILYSADSGVGVDRVTILEMTNGTYSERPEPPWWGGFRPEPAAKSWNQNAGGSPGIPIGMARGMAGWSNFGVIVFSSGFISVAGTCTSHSSDPFIQLPKNKIPTAISVTNKSEFALVSVIDVEKNKGQVAVISLSSSGKKTGFAHEWKDDYPGLPNVAVFTGMKLLGYIDIPGMNLPTSICAVGDNTTARLNGKDGNQAMLSSFDFNDPGTRDGFYKGGNAAYCPRTGFAVVGSKYENKVAFIDLQPMIQKFREMYFTTTENFKKSREMGPEPKQWPYTFEQEPTMKPVVVKVMDHPQPTAVLATMHGGSKGRAMVASLDGKVSLYQVAGLANESPADPKDIGVLATVDVGKNPVCLAYCKGSHDTFMAISRVNREILFVKYTDKSFEVIRRFKDARLIDPVHVEQADTHGTDTHLITVADFKGRKILNYRLSPIVFATNGGAKFGCGADGKADMECGGWLEFPGSPFCISATNVN